MGRYDPNLDLDPLGVAPTGPVVGSASRRPGVTESANEGDLAALRAADPEGVLVQDQGSRSCPASLADSEGVAPTGPGPGPGPGQPREARPGLLSAFQGPSPLLAVVQTFLAIYSLDNSRKKIKL